MLWLLEDPESVQFEALLPVLPRITPSRRERALSMRLESPRVQTILAELLLRHALLEEYGLTELPRVETGEKGKPFFPERPQLHFNLSHCNAALACALDSTPVGVDVGAKHESKKENPLLFKGFWSGRNRTRRENGSVLLYQWKPKT